MPVPQASEDFYKQLQRYQALLLASGRRQWSKMLPGNFDRSFESILPTLLTLTGSAQLAAATAGVAYVPEVLAEQGIDAAQDAAVRPEAFAGVAYDGRPLDTLLEGAVRWSKAYVKVGVDPELALTKGGAWLDTALQTIVTDAGSDATAVGMAVTPTATHWTRMVNPPCCSRCAVLAGVVYRRGKPKERHPRCDCQFIPSSEDVAGDFRTDPKLLAERGLIKDLTRAQRQRLDDGADLTKVLNESRDRWRADMTLRRRAERNARYTDAERRAADRRATRRAANGLRVPDGWGGGSQVQLPPGGVQDFMSHLTSRVKTLQELHDRGITT